MCQVLFVDRQQLIIIGICCCCFHENLLALLANTWPEHSKAIVLFVEKMDNSSSDWAERLICVWQHWRLYKELALVDLYAAIKNNQTKLCKWKFGIVPLIAININNYNLGCLLYSLLGQHMVTAETRSWKLAANRPARVPPIDTPVTWHLSIPTRSRNWRFGKKKRLL